jgi:hypothetical protein
MCRRRIEASGKAVSYETVSDEAQLADLLAVFIAQVQVTLETAFLS